MLQSITLFGHSINLFRFFNNSATIAQIFVLLLTLRDYKSFCTFPHLATEYVHPSKKNQSPVLWAFVFLEAVLVLLFHVLTGQKLGPLLSLIFLGEKAVNFLSNIYPFPLFFLVTAVLLKTSPLKALDYTAPIQIVGLIFFKLACYCQGCCYGYECASPFFNQANNRYEMPVQLIEIVCAVVMLAVVLIMRKRKTKPGLMYAAFMLMYCGSRFCSEFLRDDYPPILGRLNGYHIQLMIGFVFGAIYLFVVLKWGARITTYFETKNKDFLEKQLEKIASRRHEAALEKKKKEKRKYRKKKKKENKKKREEKKTKEKK